jgi:hypothetical protein
MKKILFMMLALAALTACTKLDQISGEDVKNDVYGNPIDLSGTIEDIDTRAGAGVITDPGTGGITVSVYRADMSANATPAYSSAYNTTLADGSGDGTISAVFKSDKSITMNPAQYFFKNAARKSKLISVYPSGGTFSGTARTVTFSTLDGKTDVMCTSVLEAYNSNTALILTYGHMLTKVDVKIKAKSSTDLTSINITWGTINSITVTGKNTGATVTFPSPADATTAASIASTGTGTALSLWNGTSAPAAATLTASATAFGSAMFVPSTADETLTFAINSDGGGTTNVTTSTSKKYEAGKSYTVTISFALDGDTEIEVEENDGSIESFTDSGNEDVEI